MNQDQAKFIVENWDMLSNLIKAGCVDVTHTHSPEMRRHIKKFAESGKYQSTAINNEWYTNHYFDFNDGIDMYRPVPERKINWAKAMENGAWQQKFMFWDEDAKNTTGGPMLGPLLGYAPGSYHPFWSRFISCKTYKNCKPLPGFEVPESWYEDQ